MQQQVALGAVDVQGLGAVFTATGPLSFLDQVLKCLISSRSISLSWARGRGLGEDACGEFDCVRDYGVAASQRMPGGGVGGFGGGRSAAGHRGGGASRGEVWHRNTSTGDFGSLDQI